MGQLNKFKNRDAPASELLLSFKGTLSLGVTQNSKASCGRNLASVYVRYIRNLRRLVLSRRLLVMFSCFYFHGMR